MFDSFKADPSVSAHISELIDGDMRLSAADRQTAQKNFLAKNDIDAANLVSAGLIHGRQVAIVGEKDKGRIISKTDGLVTAEKDVYLSVTVGDCLPVYFFERIEGIVGIAHAGWRGLESGIIAETILKIKSSGGSTENILAGIGPGICQRHYEVGSEVAAKFFLYGSALNKVNGRIFLDLKKVAREQLMAAGVPAENIEIDPACTFEEDSRYFSYRRTRGRGIQAMMAVIGIKE